MDVVIIEDEINAFEYLRSLLKKIDAGISIKAHIDSIRSSVNFFQSNNDFDLVFMDIQIADGLSFEIFNHINLTKPVIFTTAYDQYAIDAFKVHSVDYLLKPIHFDDLKQSIDKYHSFFNSAENHDSRVIAEMLERFHKPKKNRCLVKKGGHFEYVNVEDIAYVISQDSMTFLFTKTGMRYIYSKSIEQLFDELDPASFFRINRSQIVNSHSVKEIHPYLNQRLKIFLNVQHSAEHEFVVSRKRMTAFKEWMDQ